jgi:hypothetical protein
MTRFDQLRLRVGSGDKRKRQHHALSQMKCDTYSKLTFPPSRPCHWRRTITACYTPTRWRSTSVRISSMIGQLGRDSSLAVRCIMWNSLMRWGEGVALRMVLWEAWWNVDHALISSTGTCWWMRPAAHSLSQHSRWASCLLKRHCYNGGEGGHRGERGSEGEGQCGLLHS